MQYLPDVQRLPSPREHCSFLSRHCFWYLNCILRRGYKGNLTTDDVFKATKDMTSEHTCEILNEQWKQQSSKAKPSLFSALLKTHWRTFLIAFMIVSFEEAARMAIPFFIGWLIESFQEGGNRKDSYIYAGGIAGCTVITVISHHPYFFLILTIGLRMRAALTAMIYHKVLRLRCSALMTTSTGQIVNLVSTDVERVQQMVMFAVYLFIAPMQLIVGMVLLWQSIDASILAGFGVLVLLMPSQGILSRVFVSLRRKIVKLTDERVKIMSELISGMRVIKMYAWEESFEKVISRLRKKEISKIASVSNIRATNHAFMVSIPYIAGLASFLVYYYLDKQLTQRKVFTVMTMFQTLRVALLIFFPNTVQQLSEGYVSVRRIQKFLLMDEMAPQSVTHTQDPTCDAVVNADNFCAAWNDSGEPTLRDISFQVTSKESLLMITGPVGAGKTSILLAILKELPIYEGNIGVNGKIAYAPQLPWIYSGTVKQNILFGREYNEKRYHDVIQACSLVEDLAEFHAGDSTLVGERGVSLSGGQKARIGLARAIYSDADVFLLDDPLSAVDAKVGMQLFKRCINGFLSDKLRILVTHQIQFLSYASTVVCMKEGQVCAQGTYSSLEEQGLDLLSLVSHDHSTKSPDGDSAIVSEDGVTLSYQQPQRQISLARSFHSTGPRRSISLCSENSGYDPDHLDIDDILPMQKEVNDVFDDSPNLVSKAFLKGKEEVQRGNVAIRVYVRYFIAAAGVIGSMLLMLLAVAGQASLFAIDLWLAMWSKGEEKYAVHGKNTTVKFYNSDNRNTNVYIFIGLTVGALIVCTVRSVTFFNVFLNASGRLHNQMMSAVLKAPIYFFDSNPVGRILNRFSKDIFFMDDELPWTFFDFFQLMLVLLTVLIINIYNVPYIVLVVLPIVVLFSILREYFVRTSRDVKRIEAISRGPLYSHVSATLQGLTCIRAYHYENEAIDQMYACQDYQTEGWFLYLEASRWFGQRLDVLSGIFIICSCFAPIVISSFTTIDGSLIGVSLMYTIMLNGLFQWAVRQSTHVENLMTSVERVCEYADLLPEDDQPTSVELSPNWPHYGLITAEKASFTYHESMPPVLKNLYFCLRANEKVGIVGRTGAGKSSLLSMLFRMANITGCIRIDGISIHDLSLRDLRRRISVIPQDPVLFSGSLRYNLDPFQDYSDAEIWDALDEVQLRDLVLELPNQLYSELAESGSNFSVGQRQLLCLGRAILRKNKILVIDEGTANVDLQTDKLVQATLRDKFKDCTVLTVAHRLNTIMDSDRVMVLDAGKIVQFDEPLELLQQSGGAFRTLVNQTGPVEASRLEQMARFSSLDRREEIKRNALDYPGSDITNSRTRDELLTMFDTHVYFETAL